MPVTRSRKNTPLRPPSVSFTRGTTNLTENIERSGGACASATSDATCITAAMTTEAATQGTVTSAISGQENMGAVRRQTTVHTTELLTRHSCRLRFVKTTSSSARRRELLAKEMLAQAEVSLARIRLERIQCEEEDTLAEGPDDNMSRVEYWLQTSQRVGDQEETKPSNVYLPQDKIAAEQEYNSSKKMTSEIEALTTDRKQGDRSDAELTSTTPSDKEDECGAFATIDANCEASKNTQRLINYKEIEQRKTSSKEKTYPLSRGKYVLVKCRLVHTKSKGERWTVANKTDVCSKYLWRKIRSQRSIKDDLRGRQLRKRGLLRYRDSNRATESLIKDNKHGELSYSCKEHRYNGRIDAIEGVTTDRKPKGYDALRENCSRVYFKKIFSTRGVSIHIFTRRETNCKLEM